MLKYDDTLQEHKLPTKHKMFDLYACITHDFKVVFRASMKKALSGDIDVGDASIEFVDGADKSEKENACYQVIKQIKSRASSIEEIEKTASDRIINLLTMDEEDDNIT